MKRLILVFGVLFSLSNIQAQTAEEIIQQYSDKMGGLEAFKSVKTAVMTGTATSMGFDMSLLIHLVNNKSIRTETVTSQGTIIEVINNYGTTGWKLNGLIEHEPKEMTGQELANGKSQVSLADPLMDYEQRHHKVTLLGKEDVEGVNCYTIKLENNDDHSVSTYFIDAAEFLLVKTARKMEVNGQEVELETFYSDYKEIGGMQFAMTKVKKGVTDMTIKFSTIELNVPIDEAIFTK